MKICKSTILIGVSVVFVACTQCSTQAVRQELNNRVARKGKSYASELAAQSPFKKVEMSWKDASELMRDRNPKYRQALYDKETSKIRKGRVGNLTYEVRKSLAESVQTTLNPSEIASAMSNPVSSLPTQLKSITDLKNISHSLTQSEWDRVSLSVKADLALRQEEVNLHVLFCQSDNLDVLEGELQRVLGVDQLVMDKAMASELSKAQKLAKSERQEWLKEVRNFFNAEYYGVEFTNYRSRLDYYRSVGNPGFSDWKRWRLLENTEKLVNEMKKEHGDSKPLLPGMNILKRKLGVEELRSQLSHQSTLNVEMAKEVRQMLREWRALKAVQQKIGGLEVNFSPRGEVRAPSVAELRRVTALYQQKKKELEHLKVFWAIDEECW